MEETERAKEMEDVEAKRARQVAFDERHWSDKPLEEMKERDWRIFREDFNISTKVGFCLIRLGDGMNQIYRIESNK